MKQLLEILAGVGSAMNALGTLPQYDLPKRGDRARDLELVGNDFRNVTGRIERQAGKALAGTHGPAHNSKTTK